LDSTLNSAKSFFHWQEVIYGQIKIIKKMTRTVKLFFHESVVFDKFKDTNGEFKKMLTWLAAIL